MGDFFNKCRISIVKVFDRTFINNVANIILLLVALLLLISLMIHPTFLIALALFALFVWAFLYC